ncbi:MAG: hypothetical protein HOM11_17975 [Methylococcales bacterium]|jgi:adenosylcobinamide-GDP ribazoletransferase|nr:hypothetical protein [Methylococcales bacterium]MBT7443040.1 hypothetical protein [Methylococcales bacterium]
MNLSRLLKLGMLDKAYFLAALDQLTCIPVSEVDRSEKTSAYAVLAYPAVGGLIGLAMLLPMLLLSSSPASIVAIVGVVISVIMSQGRHIQSLAEAVLYWQRKSSGGSDDPNQMTAVLTYVMVILLLIKYAALMAISEQQSWGVIIMAPVIGRSALMMFALSTPTVGGERALAQYQNLPKMRTRMMLGMVVLASLVLLGGDIWGVLLVTLAIFYILRHHAIQQFGGVTPAMKNGMVELLETATLFVACL